jgi:SOS-response transcriptional repressor LexA
MNHLAPRQQAALGAIEAHWLMNQKAPTYAEIGAKLGITRQAVALLVRALERKGAVKRESYTPRSVRPL